MTRLGSVPRILLTLMVLGVAIWPSPASAASEGVALASLEHGPIFASERFVVNATVVDGKGTFAIQRFTSVDAQPYAAVQVVESMQISVQEGRTVAQLQGTCYSAATSGPCTTSLADGGLNYQAEIPLNDYVDIWTFRWGSRFYEGVPGQGEIVVAPR